MVPVAGSGTSLSNYQITIANGSLVINPAQLSISGLVVNSKTYDTTTAATLSGTPVVSGNTYGYTVLASGTATGSFASPNAGSAISVTPNLSGLSLNNADFVISGLTTPISANITPAPLTVNWASSPSSINGLSGQNLGINGSGQLINGTGGAAGLASNYVIVNPKPAPILSSTSNAPDMMLVSRVTQDQSFSAASAHVASSTQLTTATVADSAATSKPSSAAPLFDDRNPVATIVILHDISEVKQDLLATFKSDSVSYDIPNPVVLDPTSGSAAKPRYEATLLNGDPLPSWLKVDPDTKLLSADNVPVSALPIQIKVRTLVKGKDVKDSILTIKKL